MISGYRAFFAASTGASAAFIGLLFVALSFIDSEKDTEQNIIWRQIIANSSFSQLVNVFFVSLMGLAPDVHNVAWTGCVMAILGLIVSLRLLPKTLDTERSGRRTPTILGLLAVGAYILQFITGLGLLHNPNNGRLTNYFIVAIIVLYAGALVRAWEITGIRKRR